MTVVINTLFMTTGFKLPVFQIKEDFLIFVRGLAYFIEGF